MAKSSDKVEKLPAALLKGEMFLEEAIEKRRSVRAFKKDFLTLDHISQLLWAAQGITGSEGHRTIPSAWAKYPLTMYVVVGKVEGLAPGVYCYKPEEHVLVFCGEGDKRSELYFVSFEQEFVRDAPATLVVCGNYDNAAGKNEERRRDHTLMEVGGVAQNVSLQVLSLGLGTVVVRGFELGKVKEILGVSDAEIPLCLLPIGKV